MPASDGARPELSICTAQESDYPRVRDFYYALTDAMVGAEFDPGWRKDIYPTQEFLKESIRNGELFVGELADGVDNEDGGPAEGQVCVCMVVNHRHNEGYDEIAWSVDASDEEVLVIHALGVLPAFAGRGIAKRMTRYAIDLARDRGMKAVRLDVLEGNLPAERAYTKVGFAYRGTVEMFYEDTGWTAYRLFEYRCD